MKILHSDIDLLLFFGFVTVDTAEQYEVHAPSPRHHGRHGGGRASGCSARGRA